ncbi:MAG: YbhB/YbcL family Raf kinase inhibitor-like protein [Candidatus Zixiibacteriota bacterium]|nr:MAG: YbhB/YbcL family Raf kinase inhibitor-like protein [candidate division Zixibacteria bacterium]
MEFEHIIYGLFVLAFTAFSGGSASADDEAEIPPIELKSDAFEHEKPIPAKYSCEGEDISPDLVWSKPPEGTVELALICDDPDAPMGTWIHWIIYGIPADTGGFEESFPPVEQTETGILQGENSWGRIGYGGPCPPRGKPHRYFFKLYALDKELGLKPGADKKKLEKAMKGHIIGYGELVGTYQR